VLQVERGGLQAVEQEAGGLGIELFGQNKAQDLHDRNLDGVGVLEDGQAERGDLLCRLAGLTEFDAGFTPAMVKETVTATLERGRAALNPVDLDVLTTSDGTGINGHDEHSTPTPAT
jgi:hypothetical protein